jgi:hypothetical protein
MSIYRVVISFFHGLKQFNIERGVLAMNPGEALSMALSNLNIHMSQIHSFKSMVFQPDTLEDFNLDAALLNCIGTSYSVTDIWKSRHGES